MKQLQTSVGQKIKELRIEAGLSQEAFADKVQIHRSHLGEIERGEVDIRISQLMRVAEELGIKVSKLVQGIA